MPADACALRGGYRAQCYVDGRDIAASGLGQEMYVLAVPEQEYPPPGHAEIEVKRRSRAQGCGRVSS